MRPYTSIALISLTLLVCACSTSPTSNTAKQKQLFDEEPWYQSKSETLINESSSPQQPPNSTDSFDCGVDQANPQAYSLPTVDISLIEANVRDALLELSLMTGMSIIVDESVEGLISANLMNVKLDVALNVLLSSGNYAYKVYPDFIFVSNQSPSNPSFHLISETCSYSPNYLNVTDIFQLLPAYYRQYVTINENQNIVNITSSNKLQQRIQKNILSIDQEPEQILMELTIVEVNKESMDLLGLNWGSVQNTSLSTINKTAGKSVFTYNDMMSKQLFSMLDMLQKNGNAAIKTSPSIITLNGKEANFTSTETIWPNPEAPPQSKNNQGLVYGVNLKVIPRTSSNNQIVLNIKNASVSDIIFDMNDQPVLSSHAISNSVRVKNGGTVILGGLLQKTYSKHTAGIKGLSKIMGIGKLFQHKREEAYETEVLIIIKTSLLL